MKRAGFAFLALLWAVLACGQAAERPPAPEAPAFGNEQPVTVQGYDGVLMEPFLSRDGRYLFFNNSNDPAAETDLHYAERVDDLTFRYLGEVPGVNSPKMDAVASMDASGNFYFVSLRNYFTTFSSIWAGRWMDGRVVDVQLVAGVSPRQMGVINFDAEISADGEWLIFVDGRFTNGSVPQTADLVLARRRGGRFERLPDSDRLLAAVNTPEGLEYAPATTADGLTLFFTRLPADLSGLPVIMMSVRQSLEAPFSEPVAVPGITGFAEAPTVSPDGRRLYYHRRQGAGFALYTVSRP